MLIYSYIVSCDELTMQFSYHARHALNLPCDELTMRRVYRVPLFCVCFIVNFFFLVYEKEEEKKKKMAHLNCPACQFCDREILLLNLN